MTDDVLDTAGVAALLGIAPSTVRQYRANGRLPADDATTVPDRPRWHRETIAAWHAQRPGRGGRPRKQQQR